MSKYKNQRNNADKRGIAWEMTFREWWRIWQESGHYAQRGRGKGYCMARFGDSGPYHPDNVEIITISQNFSDAYLVKPWHVRFANSGSHNASKTHCIHGHPLSGDNLYVFGDNKRICRTCDKVRRAKYYAKKRAFFLAQVSPNHDGLSASADTALFSV